MRIFEDTQNNKAPALRIITLSGTESVTKNMTIYECGDDIIAVDCGIGFPDSEMLGVDVVIPDISYLLENKEKVRALFITHGHEDHIGAIPYLLRELDIPIYANKLVQGFIKEKLNDKNFRDLQSGVSYNLISPDTGEVSIGNFKLSAFRVNHSVPSSMGYSIKTPQGNILHMADYKVDWNPVLDKPIDIARISLYGEQGVLCLLSDCLGAATEGHSKSESSMNETFNDLFENAGDRQVFVTTISSNISRMYQIISAAKKHGRKIVLGGRSIDQSVRVAKSLGLLPFDDNTFVKEDDIDKFLQKDLVYIIAGCYGQQGSSLDRVSRGEHSTFKLEENALVIFSADPNPPGVAEDVERVMDNLTLLGAEVIYGKIQDNLHVSGHGPKGDLIMIASIVKPKYFIPIGGTIVKARAYTKMVTELGFKKDTVFELLEGEGVLFDGNIVKKTEKLNLRSVLIDSNTVDEVDSVVMRDREHLSTEGVFVVIIPLSKDKKKIVGKIEVVTRGFVYVKESKQLLGKATDVVYKSLNKGGDRDVDWNSLRSKIENDVSRFLYKQTGKRPLVIVHSITF